MDFRTFGQQFALVFDGYIQERVDQTIDTYGDALIPSLEYLYEYNQGGKALRPYMVYLRYKLCGGQDDSYQLMQIGIINELIHLFALVHDDIVDQGLVRRHRPTYHIQLRHVYDDQHVGDSQAILAGDLLYARAMQLTFHLESADARQVISEMMEKVIIGEMLDVHYSYLETEIPTDDIARKDDLKSGQYTFTAPMLLGATLAQADQQTLDLVRELGTTVGIAFQMRDDLLDRLPDDDGKTKFSDIHEGNQTVVWQYLLANISADEKTQLLSIRRKDLSNSDRDRLRDIVVRYDLMQHIGSSINDKLDHAKQLLSQGQWEEEYVVHFLEVIDFLAININKQ